MHPSISKSAETHSDASHDCNTGAGGAAGTRACSRRSEAYASAAAYARCGADSGAASQLLMRSAARLSRRAPSTSAVSPACDALRPVTGLHCIKKGRHIAQMHTGSAETHALQMAHLRLHN